MKRKSIFFLSVCDAAKMSFLNEDFFVDHFVDSTVQALFFGDSQKQYKLCENEKSTLDMEIISEDSYNTYIFFL